MEREREVEGKHGEGRSEPDSRGIDLGTDQSGAVLGPSRRSSRAGLEGTLRRRDAHTSTGSARSSRLPAHTHTHTHTHTHSHTLTRGGRESIGSPEAVQSKLCPGEDDSGCRGRKLNGRPRQKTQKEEGMRSKLELVRLSRRQPAAMRVRESARRQVSEEKEVCAVFFFSFCVESVKFCAFAPVRVTVCGAPAYNVLCWGKKRAGK